MTEDNIITFEERKLEALTQKIGEQVSDLFKSNQPFMSRIMLDQGKKSMKASFSVEITDHDGGFETKTTISYSRQYKDEREEFIDPNQTLLGLDDGLGGES